MDDQTTVNEVVAKLEAAKSHHDYFVKRYNRLERAYRGLLSPNQEAAKWRHQITPPYAFNLIESVVANTEEEGLVFRATPAPWINMPLDKAMAMLDQADAVEQLLRNEHRRDAMDEKQRPLFLSEAICGMGIGKSYWNYSTGPQKQQVVRQQPVYHPDTGVVIGQMPVLDEAEVEAVIRDHSTFEVIDPRDFMLHESARSLQAREPGGAQYVINRCWYSMEQLRSFERGGYFQNVDQLNESRDQSDEYSDREQQLFQTSRTKDLIESLEYWTYRDGRMMRAIVGNRKVVLSPFQPSPFEHGDYPFVISSSMPQLFTLRGMSTVELVEKLQEMLWALQSQRLDNIELINNAIILIRSDLEGTEKFPWHPGAQWFVDSPNDVSSFTPPYQLASLTLEAEAQLKGDLQNVTSAAPFASGVTSNVDQSTATGVSIIMNNAQKALQARKNRALRALVREANMRLKNCQQFISDRQLLHIVGPDGTRAFREIDPVDIQGEFVFELDAIGDSQMRQEKRAEATQLVQVLAQVAPLLAASGMPMNMKEVVLWALKKWNIEDGERFFSQLPEAAGAAGAPGGPAAPGQGAPDQGGVPGQPNLGVTSSTAVDASSPSATGGISASPMTFLQRAFAMARGGPANVMGG